MWELRAERPEDADAIEALVVATFGPGRFAKTAYRLREGVNPVQSLSFVATSISEKKLIGSVRFWPISVGGKPSLLLGPLTVEPDLRGQGIGIALMQFALEEARATPFETVILVGDEPYYAKVGFSRLPVGRLRFPGPVDPARILGLSLKPGALLSLSGEVRRARLDQAVCAPSAALG